MGVRLSIASFFSSITDITIGYLTRLSEHERSAILGSHSNLICLHNGEVEEKVAKPIHSHGKFSTSQHPLSQLSTNNC